MNNARKEVRLREREGNGFVEYYLAYYLGVHHPFVGEKILVKNEKGKIKKITWSVDHVLL